MTFYSPFEALLNAVGHTLKPRVHCFMSLKNQGGNIPDGGLFTPDQITKGSDKAPEGSAPGRGIIECKPPNDELPAVADSSNPSSSAGVMVRVTQVVATRAFDFRGDPGPIGLWRFLWHFVAEGFSEAAKQTPSRSVSAMFKGIFGARTGTSDVTIRGSVTDPRGLPRQIVRLAGVRENPPAVKSAILQARYRRIAPEHRLLPVPRDDMPRANYMLSTRVATATVTLAAMLAFKPCVSVSDDGPLGKRSYPRCLERGLHSQPDPGDHFANSSVCWFSRGARSSQHSCVSIRGTEIDKTMIQFDSRSSTFSQGEIDPS